MRNSMFVIAATTLALGACEGVAIPGDGPRYQTAPVAACPKIGELNVWTNRMPGPGATPTTYVQLTLEDYLPYGLSRINDTPPGEIVLSLNKAPGKPRRSFKYSEIVGDSGKTDRVLIICNGNIVQTVEPVQDVY